MREIKPIIFANPVKDLTMARYLAAMQVDFFGIDLDSIDVQKTKTFIQQIKEWVEGPKLIGVSAMPSKNINAVYPLDGYYLDVQMTLPENVLVLQTFKYFLKNQNSIPSFIIIDNVHDCIESQQNILKTSILQNPIWYPGISGFMISPGVEEKIGMYDFEKLDEWFGNLGKW